MFGELGGMSLFDGYGSLIFLIILGAILLYLRFNIPIINKIFNKTGEEYRSFYHRLSNGKQKIFDILTLIISFGFVIIIIIYST